MVCVTCFIVRPMWQASLIPASSPLHWSSIWSYMRLLCEKN